MNKEEILSIEKCDCGRPWCEYFGGGVGENGASFTRKRIEQMLKNLPEIEVHLKELLT